MNISDISLCYSINYYSIIGMDNVKSLNCAFLRINLSTSLAASSFPFCRGISASCMHLRRWESFLDATSVLCRLKSMSGFIHSKYACPSGINICIELARSVLALLIQATARALKSRDHQLAFLDVRVQKRNSFGARRVLARSSESS